jgi:hypothetical protein
VIEVAVVVLVVPTIGVAKVFALVLASISVDKVFALELASIGVEAEDGLELASIGVEAEDGLELASIDGEAEDGLGGVVVLILLMPMATKFDQRKKIKKLTKHKRNQKNNLAKNFLLPNFNLIANNNLNI